MYNRITKTVSMFLVAVMLCGVAVMPMRASAADIFDPVINLIPDPVWREVVRFTKNIAVEMTSATTTSELEAAASAFAAYFENTLSNDLLYVTADQMSDLSASLIRMGIQVMLGVIPGTNLFGLLLADNVVTTPVGTVTLDADVGSIYTYNGRSIVRIPGGSAAEEDRDSFDSTTSTETDVGINGDGSLVDIDVNVKDSGSTTPGAYVVFNNVTNQWEIKNEYGDYVAIDSLYYNPVTQNYDISYDNRQYTYQFYYEYTYITYIGSSAEYREAYKIYYELPDGRSSGDLTADELKGLSLQFDMVNYDKVASDNLTQILLPFDGSLDNTSYYDVTTGFYRTAGYSFLESPDPFGGSLFVPISNSRGFNAFGATLSNPLPVNSGFTVQGRFYLDGTFTSGTSFEDTITFYLIGSSPEAYWENEVCAYEMFSLTGTGIAVQDNYYGGDIASLSVGVWHDFCFVYDPEDTIVSGSPFGSVSLYLDGIRIYHQEHYESGCYPIVSLADIVNPSYTSELYSIESWSFSGFGFSNGNNTAPIMVDNMRMVSAPLYSSASTITIPQAPFDTNLVYILPSVARLNANTVAIMSQLPVTGYRVGGIRPTDPTLSVGYIYMHIEGDYVDSVQQWNGSFWESVTARLYTGVRWIPVSAFNVYTMEDMFDIIDPNGSGSDTGLDSIYQYYLWWSGEWGSFQEWLKGTLQTLIGAIQNNGGSVVIVPGVNDQTTTNEIVTENPDGSTTVTVIVSNSAGLVYSRSTTTWPPNTEGTVHVREVYTDSTGVMYQAEWDIDKDGNVVVTQPSEATGTLSQILKMITGGVMSIATTVIEGFVEIVVEGVKFIIQSAGRLLDGIGSMLGSVVSSATDFTDSVGDVISDSTVETGDGEPTYGFLDLFLNVLPVEITTALTLCFVCMIVFPLINKMHF